MKAILIDAGGVILDESEFEQVNARLISEMIDSEAGPYSEEQYWLDVEESVQRYCPSTRGYVFWKNCGGDSVRFNRIWEEFLQTWQESTPPLTLMEGIEAEISELSKSFSLVLAGQYGAGVYELLSERGLDGCFVNRLSQDDFTITKPDPRYVEMIAEMSGFKPCECVMIGDRIDKDVIPAKQNGMGTVLVRTGMYRNQTARLPEEMPDIMLDGVQGLAEGVMGKWCAGRNLSGREVV